MAGYPTFAPQPGYGVNPPYQGGYGAPPPFQGNGAPQNAGYAQGYGQSAPVGGGYGYSGPSQQPPSGSYGYQPQGGYGEPGQQAGYGAPQRGYFAPQGSYGAPPQQGPQGGYGYGSPPPQGYDGPPQGGAQGGGGPPLSQPQSNNQLFGPPGAPEQADADRGMMTGALSAGLGAWAGHHMGQPSHSANYQRLEQTCKRIGMSEAAFQELKVLDGCEICVIVDDSSSMMSQLATGRTRWDELREIVSIISEVAVCIDPDGLDLYFLNAGPVRNINSTQAVQQVFAQKRPNGLTPLATCLRQVLQEKHSGKKRDMSGGALSRGMGSNLMMAGVGAAAGYAYGQHQGFQGSGCTLIVIATDGTPTDGAQQFIETLRSRDAQRFPVSILACTDVRHEVEYLNRIDQSIKRTDVSDDYASERMQIKQSSGREVSFGDYVAKCLCGPVSKRMDGSDERRHFWQ